VRYVVSSGALTRSLDEGDKREETDHEVHAGAKHPDDRHDGDHLDDTNVVVGFDDVQQLQQFGCVQQLNHSQELNTFTRTVRHISICNYNNYTYRPSDSRDEMYDGRVVVLLDNISRDEAICSTAVSIWTPAQLLYRTAICYMLLV